MFNENPALTAKKLDLLKQQLALHQRQNARAEVLLKLGFVLTFLLHLAFNMHLYLGDPLSWVHYFKDWQSTLGFAFMVVIVGLMALFLAWVKHHAYLHFGLYGSIPLIVVTVIGFALFAEFFSSSANQDAKSHIQLENNSAYQQTLAYHAGSAIQADPVLTAQIAKASQKLAQCEEKRKVGKEPHCNGDRDYVHSLEARAQAMTQAQVQAATAGQQANYARQDKLKADSYNPAIVMVAQFLAALSGGVYADYLKAVVVLVMLFVAVCFEILHHFLSQAKERAQNAVISLELEMAKLESVAGSAGVSVSPTPPDSGYKSTKPGFGFMPQTAQREGSSTAYSYPTTPPLFKYQLQPAGQPARSGMGFMGFVPPDYHTAQTPEPVRSQPGALLPTATTPVAEAPGIPGQATGPDTGYTRSASGPGSTQPTAAAHTDKVLLDAIHDLKNHAGEQAKRAAVDLYPVWKQRVLTGDLKPTKRPCQKFIWKETATADGKKKAVLADETLKIWNLWIARAIREGFIREDPNWSNGKDKYILT